MIRKATGYEFSSPKYYKDWSSKLVRYWSGSLPANEFVVLMFILDRTLGWGKEWETISSHQIVEGVYNKDRSVCYHSGCNMSLRTAQACIRTLVEKGAVRAAVGCYGPHNSLAYALNFEWKPTMLRLPKAKKEGVAKSATPPWQKLPPPIANIAALKKIDNKRRENNKDGRAATVAQEIHETHRIGRLNLRSKLTSSPNLKRTEVQKLWEILFKDYYPDSSYFVWKGKDAIILHAYAKRYAVAAKVPFGQYLEWVVKNWKMIMSTHMAWAKNPPPFPAPSFLVGCSRQFEMAFASRKQLEAEAALPSRDRAIKKLTDRGMAYDAATAEVDEMSGVAKQLRQVRDLQQRTEADKLAIARAQTAPLKPGFMKSILAKDLPRVRIIDQPGDEE